MHCVYKITFNNRKNINKFPYYYIGSKSNCTYTNGTLYDKNGKPYYGSSHYNGYYDIVKEEIDNIITEILYIADNYDDALEHERLLHINNNVVLSDEYFNQQIATISTYSNPLYKTMKNIKNGKVARLLECEITDDWKGVSYGKSWYNNGVINKTFNPDSVPDGWIKGRLNYKGNPNNFYKNGKVEAIKKSVEQRKNNGSYIAHNKGKKGLYIPTEENKKNIREAQQKRASRADYKNGMEGKIFITNGIKNKVINKNEDIPKDWNIGVTRKAKS